MSNEFNKTEADYAYERYGKMGDIPAESNEPIGATPADFDGVQDEGTDPVLVGDDYIAADIGLDEPEQTLGRRADRNERMIVSAAPERDELLESDAVVAAGAAGLTGGAIDVAAEDELDEPLNDAGEDLPLEDIPAADDLQADTPVDPASPPVDVLPGIDVLNGSQGEE